MEIWSLSWLVTNYEVTAMDVIRALYIIYTHPNTAKSCNCIIGSGVNNDMQYADMVTSPPHTLCLRDVGS